jgi:hypothetical protein
VRTLRFATEELHGVTIGPTHPCLTWMVRHAAFLYNRGQRDANGRTPYELIKGRSYKRALPAFGEKIFYLPVGKRASKLHDRWLEEIFMGVADRTDEIYVGTTKGIVRARSFKRLPTSAQTDKALFCQVKGLTWNPVPGDPESSEAPPANVKVVADAVVPDVQLPPVIGPRNNAPQQARRVYIRREVELVRYGYTPGCSGCMAAALGEKAVVHSEECRRRIEESMAADTVTGGQERLGLAAGGRNQAESAAEASAKRRRTARGAVEGAPAPGPQV